MSAAPPSSGGSVAEVEAGRTLESQNLSGRSATDEERFTAPVQTLRGVGERTAALLARLGVETVQDLLFFFPRKYEDRRIIRSPGAMVPGERCAVLARVERLERLPTRREGLLLVRAVLVGDEGDRGEAVWFSRRGFERQLVPGR